MMRVALLIPSWWIGLLSVSATAQSPADSSLLRIWHPSRTYHYWVAYIEASGDTLSSEELLIHPTGQVWDRDPQQTLATFMPQFSTADSIELATDPPNGQRLRWSRSYQEGVIENSSRVWMHPLRSNQHVLTEVAPFPEVKFPLEEGRTWKSSLFIYEAMGTFEGTLSCNYAVMGQGPVATPMGDVTCWEVFSTGLHDRLGRSSATFYFNEQLGFVRMEYSFFNGRQIDLQLVGLDEAGH